MTIRSSERITMWTALFLIRVTIYSFNFSPGARLLYSSETAVSKLGISKNYNSLIYSFIVVKDYCYYTVHYTRMMRLFCFFFPAGSWARYKDALVAVTSD